MFNPFGVYYCHMSFISDTELVMSYHNEKWRIYGKDSSDDDSSDEEEEEDEEGERGDGGGI